MSRWRWAAVAAATAAAFWPTWGWYAARLRDGADEKWGLAALACALLLALRRRSNQPAPPALLAMAGLVVCYAALSRTSPPLARAIPALVAVALLASAARYGRGLHPGTVSLLLLALPLESTLQFYLGFPMRTAATWLASAVLRAGGLGVSAAGTLLQWRGETLGVDAPCSGIHMLWAALFLAALVSAAGDHGIRATAAGAAAAGVIVVAANGLRVALLFVKESGVLGLPGWTHEAIGLAVFAGAVATILGVLRRIEPKPTDAPPATATRARPSSRGIAVYAGLCLATALLPFLPGGRDVDPATEFGGWPETLDGAPLTPVASSPRDQRFARGFPGRVARFTDGRRSILLRWTPAATRLLHPAADCFRGDGFAVRPRPSRLDGAGRRWACFEARRGTEAFTVCERIAGDKSGSWTDASSWWWAAALGRAQGPFWAITVVEAAEGGA